jgi:hypothetical protein
MQTIVKRINPYLLLALLIIGYYALAFFPYELATRSLVENQAQFLSDGSLSFERGGIALSLPPHSWLRPESSVRPTKFYVETFSLSSEQTGPARIVSFSIDPFERNITIGQENSDLIVRIRKSMSNLNGTPNFVIADVFGNSSWRTIEVRLSSDSFQVLVDGATRLSESLPTGYWLLWDDAYPLVFGNEASGDRVWQGYIRKAQVCAASECVNYVQPSMLQLPKRYWSGPTWRNVLDNQHYFATTPTDVFINLLFFMPLGFLLARLAEPPVGLAKALIVATLISVSIEAVQFILAYRVTSLIDVIVNLVGSGLGFGVGKRVRAFNI